MMPTTAVDGKRPFFEISGFRFRLWPIALAAVLMQGLLVPAREAARWFYRSQPDLFHGQVWAFVGLALLLQVLGALACILIMRRVLPQADACLRWPPARSYVGLAAAIGVAMGLVMLLADYWPQILSGSAPEASYELSPVAIPGWLFVMLSTGLAEETLFRGLLVGMLVVLVPGRVRAGNFDVPVAGIVVGLLFSVAHYRTFIVDPLHLAIAQQLYAFVWALLYVWLMERSRSLVAPIVAHGVGNFVEVGAVMMLMAAWN
jgi:hypothetical protein